MYNKNTLIAIATSNKSVFEDLHKIRLELGTRFVDMDDAILALLLSIASNEPLLLVGPPGTSKSRLIRSFCGILGLIDENKLGGLEPDYNMIKDPLPGENSPIGYFEYLLTPFTEPNELFGYYDIGKLMNPNAAERKLERDEARMIHKAYVVFLDEVFNASSAILNSLLAFLQERIFHDRGDPKPAYTRAFFAATNFPPESAELRAVYDRFLLRCHVKNIDVKQDGPGHFQELIQVGFTETYGKKTSNMVARQPSPVRKKGLPTYSSLFTDLSTLQERIRLETEKKTLLLDPKKMEDHPFMKNLRQVISNARRKGLSEMSNRRVLKMMYVLLIYCMYRSTTDPLGADPYEFSRPELQLIEKYFLDRPTEIPLYPL